MPDSIIYHGDCLDVLRALADNSVDAVVTDPPYGIGYQSAWRTDAAKRKPRVANDSHPFVWFLWDAARILKDGGAMVCFCDWRHQDLFRGCIEAAGLTIRGPAVWDREIHGMADVQTCMAPRHDFMWFASKGRFVFPSKRPASVFRHKRISGSNLEHPTEKPVELMRDLVRAVTPPNGTVLDPFAGSGSTGKACALEGFGFIGVEREAEYVEIARARIAAVA